MRLAAIDIGSNAGRLLINDVLRGPGGTVEFIKMALIRVPLRLGFDVFETGRISVEREEMMIKTLQSYRLLMDVYGVQQYRAAATSAMRGAANSKEVLEKIERETGIRIEVIDGHEEARLLHESHEAEKLSNLNSYLYINVGGGSTELTFFSEGQLQFNESFDIGTIRLLKDQVGKPDWEKLKDFIRERTRGRHVTCIGSGGNINKIFSLSKKKEGKPLNLEHLRNYYKEFSSLSLRQRMQLYKLREDRADVIVPALLIYINVMRWVDAEDIFVPKMGVADGLIHSLFESLTKHEPEKWV
ncbi:MAG: exopolyphosphatase [Chitinophagaceae bacterium]|nr:MAG: exopolyphosphatase [Chitinophagaceae bacterium]